ncbi:MAG: hypothetical protein AVO33_03535 [delta proteobacterium ML8_F1]|nr:MAG: hypothetical protein AVO33_03535 [delta proteobacterium ML8_F1]
MVSAVILAAGKSERYGRNKLMLPLGGKKLIEVILETVAAVGFDEVVMVYGEEIVGKMAQKFQIRTVLNPESNLGLSKSVKYGIEALKRETEGIMFFLGDQPNIKREIILELIEVFLEDPKKIVVPTCNRVPGNPVIFPQKYSKILTGLTGDQGGKQIIANLDQGVVYHRVQDGDFCTDIDTPEDYEKFLYKKMSEEV